MRQTSGHLDQLESESIHILREVAAQFARPVLLFSGGKDSIGLVHLAKRAFFPEPVPFTLLHIDTGHNFPEALTFRDALVASLGLKIIVRKVEDTIRQGRAKDESGPYPSRNYIQSVTLLDALTELKADAAIGGARRDEEKARAKERIFSVRDRQGRWDPSRQRPELWTLYNGMLAPGEHMRVFPLSNWTELDVWQYLERERIAVPSLYFAHRRKCVRRADGTLLALSSFIAPPPGDEISELAVRFRTVGDMTCTCPLESTATTVAEIINEIKTSRITERGFRADDMRSESAMEDRKREGYF